MDARQQEVAALMARAGAAELRTKSVAEERERAPQIHHSEIARL